MDAWKQTFDQLRSVCRGLSVAQRVSVLFVSLGVLTGIGWLAVSAGREQDQFLLGGKSFSTEELARTQAALKSAGLTGGKVVGRKIAVPSDQVDRYTAAALAQQALPAQFAAEFDRMQAKVNVFTSTEQRRELLEEARKTRLAQILRSIPEIEDAVVEWDRPRAASLFRPAPQLAAHVSVKPRDGRELSLELVQSLKLFIAGALAGARTDDVTVVDMNTSRVYGRRSAREAASERVQEITKQHTDNYSQQCARALRYIPDVLVSVHVELRPEALEVETQESFVGTDIVPVRRQRERTRTRTSINSNRPATGRLTTLSASRELRDVDLEGPSSTIAHATYDQSYPDDDFGDPETGDRTAVRVEVSIPDDYYSAIARSRGLNPGQSLTDDSAYRAGLVGIKAETRRDVREKLIRLLPSGSDPSAVLVTTYTPLKADHGTQRDADAGSIRHVADAASVGGLQAKPSILSTDWLANVSTDWRIGTGISICGACLIWVACRAWPRRAKMFKPMSEPMSKQPASTAPPVAAQIEPDGSDQPTPTAVIPETAPSNPHAAVLDKLAELGRQSPAVQASRIEPFAFLAELSVIEAARLLEHEHPQTIALVATALAPARAAEILHSMPESLRWDVTQRLARIGTATPDVLCEVAASLESRRRNHRTTPVSDMSDSAATFPNSMEIEQPERPQASELSAHEGEASAEPAGLAVSNDARGIQETLGSPRPRNRGQGAGGEGVCATRDDPSSSPEEKHSVPSITFEDLLNLDRRSLALIWESVEPRSSAAALLDRSEAFKTALLNKLPKPVSVAIRQHLRNLGPIRMSEITTHQEAIADRARELGCVVSMKHES